MDLCAPRATGAPFPPAAIDPAATVAVFHTSGTSGFPKGAALSSNALLGARASTVIAGCFWDPKDLALIALPWSHIMAVSIALYGLMAGIRGCFLDRFDVAARWSWSSAWRHHRRRRARHVRAAGQQQSRSRPAQERARVALGQRSPAREVRQRCGSSARCCGCRVGGAFRRCC
jgi:acyl-CoA synthetase (AMP-forming)/AMP-acid ligase II